MKYSPDWGGGIWTLPPLGSSPGGGTRPVAGGVITDNSFAAAGKKPGVGVGLMRLLVSGDLRAGSNHIIGHGEKSFMQGASAEAVGNSNGTAGICSAGRSADANGRRWLPPILSCVFASCGSSARSTGIIWSRHAIGSPLNPEQGNHQCRGDHL